MNKYTLNFFLILCVYSLKAQNNVSAVIDVCYQITGNNIREESPINSLSELLNPFSLVKVQKKNRKTKVVNEFSLSEFYMIMNLQPFNYFDELSPYNTPLKKKIYKEDNAIEYNNYLDSLKKLKAFHKTELESLTYAANYISNYDLKTKLFTQEVKLYSYNEDVVRIKQEIARGNLFFKGIFFTAIQGVKQNVIGNSPLTIRTTFEIKDERKALEIEYNKSLSLSIFFNRYRVSAKINRAECALIHIICCWYRLI